MLNVHQVFNDLIKRRQHVKRVMFCSLNNKLLPVCSPHINGLRYKPQSRAMYHRQQIDSLKKCGLHRFRGSSAEPLGKDLCRLKLEQCKAPSLFFESYKCVWVTEAMLWQAEEEKKGIVFRSGLYNGCQYECFQLFLCQLQTAKQVGNS